MPDPRLSSLPPLALRPDAMHLEMMARRQGELERQLAAIRQLAEARRQQQINMALELQRLELMRQREAR